MTILNNSKIRAAKSLALENYIKANQEVKNSIKTEQSPAHTKTCSITTVFMWSGSTNSRTYFAKLPLV
jgi:hypothetical protein